MNHFRIFQNCQKKTAKCIQFQCVIYRLGRMQATTITVKARLWNTTLVEDYPRVSHVNIASTAYIVIPEHYNLHQSKHHDDSATVRLIFGFPLHLQLVILWRM